MVRRIIKIIWRWRWCFVFSLTISIIAAFIYLKTTPPVYRNVSRLYVERSGPKIISREEGVLTQSKNYFYTQAELLLSTPVLSKVADDPAISSLDIFKGKVDKVSFLKKGLRSGVGKTNDVISLGFDSHYPEQGAQVVNAIVNAYVSYHADRKRSTSQEVLEILKNEKRQREAELNEKLQKILEFNQNNTVFAFQEDRQNVVLQRLSTLSDALTKIQLENIDKKTQLETIKSILPNPDMLENFIRSPESQKYLTKFNSEQAQLKEKLKRFETKLKTMLQYFTHEHPSVQKAKAQIAETNNELDHLGSNVASYIEQEVSRQWQTVQKKQEQIQKSFDAQKLDLQELNTREAELAILKSEANRIDRINGILDERIKEMNVTDDVGIFNITILETARKPRAPISPNTFLVLLTAIICGTAIGSTLVFIMEMSLTGLSHAKDISAVFQVPILGMVPRMSDQSSISSCGQQVRLQPDGIASQGYQTIRNRLQYYQADKNVKTILIASAESGEGKSLFASNIAISFAKSGQRTLIVDANLRNPMQHEVFLLNADRGLTSVLSGQNLLSRAIQQTSSPSLDVLPAGPLIGNPSDVLGSDVFHEILSTLSKSYDRVIVDSTAMNHAADSAALGAVCDATLLIVKAEKTTRKAGLKLMDRLESVGSHILGVVVNDVFRDEENYINRYQGMKEKSKSAEPIAVQAPVVVSQPVSQPVHFSDSQQPLSLKLDQIKEPLVKQMNHEKEVIQDIHQKVDSINDELQKVLPSDQLKNLFAASQKEIEEKMDSAGMMNMLEENLKMIQKMMDHHGMNAEPREVTQSKSVEPEIKKDMSD